MDSRYVLITYSVIPRDNKITGIKGWRDIPNALQTAKMILDTRNKTIEKNSFDKIVSYDQAMEYLKKHYPKYFPDA